MTKEAPAKETGKQQDKEHQVTFHVMAKDGKTVLVATDDAASILKANPPPPAGGANEEDGQVVKQTSSKGKSNSKKPKKSTPDRANKEPARKDSKGHQGERRNSKSTHKKKSKSKQSLKTHKSKTKTSQPSMVIINIENLTVIGSPAPTEAKEGGKQQAPAAKENPNVQGSPGDHPAGPKPDKEDAKADGKP